MNNIKHFRVLAGLTQEQLGHAVNVGQGAIGHYESGRRAPDLEACRAIADALATAGAMNGAGEPVTLDDIFPPSETDTETRKTA